MPPSHRPSPTPIRAWLALLGGLALALALLIDSPAWAAPVLRPLNQTVPRPTPTPSDGPVATATPRPDDDDNGEDTGGGDAAAPEAGETPGGGLQLFPQQPGGEAGAPADTGLTASVTVAVLNVREGPGTNFAILGSLAAGDRIAVNARSADGAWWYICCLPGDISGWISAQLVAPDFDRSQADTLLPVFGSVPAATPRTTGTPPPPADQPASQPLSLGFLLDPPFVWQGITATLTISVTNPNTVDVRNVELSDELPAVLDLVAVVADADGEIEQRTTPNGNTLVIVRWSTIPADTSVSAALTLTVDPSLPNGAVIDNLVGARGRNAPYSAGALTIGMPPVSPPTFQ